MNQIFTDLSLWLRANQSLSAMAFVSTLFVIYGSNINKAVKQFIKKMDYPLRLATFVLICSVGYGLAITFAIKGLTILLAHIPLSWLLLSEVAAFLALGFLAERKNYI